MVTEYIEYGLSLKAKDIALVINEPNDRIKGFLLNDIHKRLNDFLESVGCIYYSILHDLDVDEKGVLKRPHLHYVICSPKRRMLKTFLMEYAFCVNNDVNCISIGRVTNVELSIQYLIHKNSPGKFLYDISKVFSNDNHYTDILLRDITPRITADYLKELIVDKQLNDFDIAKILTPSVYIHYLPLIRSIRTIFGLPIM